MGQLKYFIRGVGVALFLTASFFYLLNINSEQQSPSQEISDEEVISRAKVLGMIFISDANNKDENGKDDKDKDEGLTEAEIIKLAEDLGMTFEDTSSNLNGQISDSTEVSHEDTSSSEEETPPMVDDQQKDAENQEQSAEQEESDSHEEDSTIVDVKKPIESVRIKISYGLSSDDIAQLLHDEGVVDDALAFNKYIIINKYDKKLQTGTYEFIKGSSYEDIINKFTD